MKKPSLLLVGSIPPPYHGQAVVTEMVFKAEYRNANITTLNLPFSEDLEAVGGVKLKKLHVLLKGIVGMVKFWWSSRNQNRVLYYCAGSAYWVPLIKDAILLGVVGRLFRHRVVHYHSGGLPEWFSTNTFAGLVGKFTYTGVSKALALTKAVKVPCYNSTKLCVVPNGLDIEPASRKRFEEGLRFLYLGSIRETKGIGVILEAVNRLKEQYHNHNWQVEFVGEWAIESERKQWLSYIAEKEISDLVIFSGRKVGSEKWQAYADADAFLFPSHYESENQPLVIIEAMGMGLPVITTQWRGISELVEDGVTGMLIPTKNPTSLAEKMRIFFEDKQACAVFAKQAKERYQDRYTKKAFIERMIDSFHF